MIGNNTLTLNAATMIAALQYYLENVVYQTGKCPKVQSVKYDAVNYTFAVSVTSEVPEDRMIEKAKEER